MRQALLFFFFCQDMNLFFQQSAPDPAQAQCLLRALHLIRMHQILSWMNPCICLPVCCSSPSCFDNRSSLFLECVPLASACLSSVLACFYLSLASLLGVCLALLPGCNLRFQNVCYLARGFGPFGPAGLLPKGTNQRTVSPFVGPFGCLPNFCTWFLFRTTRCNGPRL